MHSESGYYSNSEIDKISTSLSVVAYFFYLQNRGEVKFHGKIGREYYFKTDDSKFSVSESGYYDFKTGDGGHILKAVMSFEKLDWKDALEFVKNFDQNFMPNETIVEGWRLNSINDQGKPSNINIINSFVPNNKKLISYFENRGISNQILIEHTKQIHYEVDDKNYFGIGIENISGGFDIRNSLMKSKIGKNDLSEIKGTKDEVIVFEGMTDMLSFAQLLKVNNQHNNRTLLTLNSITNLDKFLERYSDYKGKIFLCLDGDKSGNQATQQILNTFTDKEVKDIRSLYNISDNGNNDLNEYLQNKLKLQNKKVNLVEQNSVENENSKILSSTDNRETSKTLESQQDDDNSSDKSWAAKMLEMDLKNQIGSIYQEEESQNQLEIHNEKMLQKMKAEKISWMKN